MNASAVATRYPNAFGSYAVVINAVVPLGATGNAVATLPILGATNYIVRRVTASLPSANIATANVVVLTSSDGNTSNALTNNVVLSTMNIANTTWQDLGLATAATTNSYRIDPTTGANGALYVKVNANTGAGQTCQLAVYADIVSL
jgi:hypothetical protein